MLTRKTVIDDIQVSRVGEIKVTLAIIVLDDEEEIASSYFYIGIKPGASIDEQVNTINAELAQTKKPPIEDFTLLKNVAEVVMAAEAVMAKIDGEKI